MSGFTVSTTPPAPLTPETVAIPAPASQQQQHHHHSNPNSNNSSSHHNNSQQQQQQHNSSHHSSSSTGSSHHHHQQSHQLHHQQMHHQQHQQQHQPGSPPTHLSPDALHMLQRLRAFRADMNASIDGQLKTIADTRSQAMMRLTATRTTLLQRVASPTNNNNNLDNSMSAIQHHGGGHLHHHHHHHPHHHHPHHHHHQHHHLHHQQQQQQHNMMMHHHHHNNNSRDGGGPRGGGGGGGGGGWTNNLDSSGASNSERAADGGGGGGHQQHQQRQLSGSGGADDWTAAVERSSLATPPITPNKPPDQRLLPDPNDSTLSNMLGSPSQKGTVQLDQLLSAFMPQSNGYSLFSPPPKSNIFDSDQPHGSSGGEQQTPSSSSSAAASSQKENSPASPTHEEIIARLLQEPEPSEQQQPIVGITAPLGVVRDDSGERSSSQQPTQQHQNNNNNNDDGNGNTAAGATTADDSIRTVSVERLVKLYGHQTAKHLVLVGYHEGRPIIEKIPGTQPDTPASLGGIDVSEEALPCQTIVQFKNNRLLQVPFPFFVAPGQHVFVEVDRGRDLGVVIFTATSVLNPTGGKQLLAGLRNARLGKVVGVASAQSRGVGLASDADIALWKQLGENEAKSVTAANRLAQEHGVPLTFVDAEYQFDRSKLTVYYPRDTPKTDFRELVRALYKNFRARIWLEAVGENTSLPRES